MNCDLSSPDNLDTRLGEQASANVQHCLFERLFKVKKSGVFLFGISFFVFEMVAFLYYANEESDDIIDRSTKTIKY